MIENIKMTEEKKVLMKCLKDENLREETRKYTNNLINKTSKSFISSSNRQLKEINFDNKTENNINEDKINDLNKEINKSEEASIKKKKKIKLKKNDKYNNSNEKNVLKSGEVVKKGKKIKLKTPTKLNDLNNEKDNKENKKEGKINQSDDCNKDKDKKGNEIKPIIKDKEINTNRTRKDLLNSLNSLQYNFDNLMAIGVHGTKSLNIQKK